MLTASVLIGRTNSDFNLQSVTYSRITLVEAPEPPSEPTNDLPSADDDTASTEMNQEISIDVLGNDSFGGDGPGVGQVSVGKAMHGQVSVRKVGTRK